MIHSFLPTLYIKKYKNFPLIELVQTPGFSTKMIAPLTEKHISNETIDKNKGTSHLVIDSIPFPVYLHAWISDYKC